MEPLISVLIPVYGVEKYIEQCLKSLFENTISAKCEFIIVNDCTKDNSMLIAEKVIGEYRNLNVKIINHDQNKGLATTRNTGLANASGKYLICTDSDDWVEPNYLERLYAEAESKHADITICRWRIEKGTESWISDEFHKFKSEEAFESFMKCKIPAYVWNKLVRRSLFVENGFKWVDGINNWEDETICIKLFSKAKTFAFVEDCLYHYRCRDDSYIRCIINDRTKRDFLAAIESMEKFLSGSEYEKFRDLVKYKKLHVKMKFLMDGTYSMQRKFISMWPETHSCPLDETCFSPRQKLILKTSKTLPPISLLMLFCLSILKITVRKRFSWKEYFGKGET